MQAHLPHQPDLCGPLQAPAAREGGGLCGGLHLRGGHPCRPAVLAGGQWLKFIHYLQTTIYF